MCGEAAWPATLVISLHILRQQPDGSIVALAPPVEVVHHFTMRSRGDEVWTPELVGSYLRTQMVSRRWSGLLL